MNPHRGEAANPDASAVTARSARPQGLAMLAGSVLVAAAIPYALALATLPVITRSAWRSRSSSPARPPGAASGYSSMRLCRVVGAPPAIVSGHDIDPASPWPEDWLVRAARDPSGGHAAGCMCDGVPRPVAQLWVGTGVGR